MTTRSPADVFAEHLRLRASGDLETDLRQDFADDVVLLCSYGAFDGVAHVRESGEWLRRQMPNSRFTYVPRQVCGEFAFLEWQAESDQYRVTDGAASFVIRDGRIRMQSIHYTLQPRAAGK